MAKNHIEQMLIGGKFLVNFNNLIAWPARTGIQRVCYEFCSRWPYIDDTLAFVELGMDRIGILDPSFFESVRQLFEESDDVLKVLSSEFPDLNIDFSLGMIGLRSARNRVILEVSVADALKNCRAVLSLEESLNIEFFSVAAASRPEKIFNLCHDFLSWTHSEYFPTNWNSADNICISASNRRKYANNFFTSTTTRDVFTSRINRGDTRSYAVIPPGADGLGRMFRKDVPSSREFLVVGTLEPRKQPIRILRAFEALQASGHDARLCFAGRMGWLEAADKAELITAFKTYSWLRWEDGPGDDELRDLVMNCRATIYLSVAEGFGSPPVESLALGVPCIVSADLPSAVDMDSGGQIRIAHSDDEALVDAVGRLLDDSVVADLQHEIETLELPTWQAFVDGIVTLIDRNAPYQCEGRGRPSFRASLNILNVLSLMPQLERRELIQRLALAVNPETSDRDVMLLEINSEYNSWSNADLLLNLIKSLDLPAGLVSDALAGRLDSLQVPDDFAKEWRERFLALMQISSFPDFIAAIYTDIHGRAPSADELQNNLPFDEVEQTRIAFIRGAINSSEYKEQCVRLMHQNCPDESIDKVDPVEISWLNRVLDKLNERTSVARALLIRKDEDFITTASLDLTGQLPSTEVLAALRSVLRGRFGRERALLRLLLSDACLRRVFDPGEHLQLIHHLAARAGLMKPVPISEFEIASRTNSVLALGPDQQGKAAFALFFGREISSLEVDLVDSEQNFGDVQALVSRFVIYGTLSGDLAFSPKFVTWASEIILRNSEQQKGEAVNDGNHTVDKTFKAYMGRPANSQETAVLVQAAKDGFSETEISKVIRLTAIRQKITIDLLAEVTHFAKHNKGLIAGFGKIIALAESLQVVSPQPQLKPWSRPRAPVAAEVPRMVEMTPQPFHQNTVTNPTTVDQLMAADGVDFLKAAYRVLLLREADSSGLENYLKAMSAGLRKTKIIYSLATSPEGRAANANLVGLKELLNREQKLRRWYVRKLMKIVGIRP